MTVGLSPTLLANKWLNMLNGTAFASAPTACYIELHTADPGVNGTTSTSVVTTRQAVTWSAASGGALTLSNAPSFTMTGTETISHVAVWDASTSGNFLFSSALTASKAVVATDVLTFTTFGVSFTPIAA